MSIGNVIQLAIAGVLFSCVLGLQRPPPRYSQQFMPETSFTCRNKIVGSYYADPETDCQLFHVCVSVAGVIQDYKFLCPNDTAFDQESQTCADWYDVDCEAATLYYASDNFDLYRIGSGLESLHYDALRSDAEPQDHLQRSESNDPVRSAANNLNRVSPTTTYNQNSGSRDILRGSSSSNFYNSRNSAKDEDYDSDKYQEPAQEPKKKPGVRKVARKQQYNTPSSTAAPAPSSTYNNYNNNYNGNYYNNHRTTYETTTTARPTQNSQKFNAAPSTFRPPSTAQAYSTYQPSTTARPSFNNYQANYNQNTNYPQAQTTVKPITYSQNFQHVTTQRPTTYNQNYDNYNNQYNNQYNRSPSTTAAPSTNYQQADYTAFQQRSYNNIQRSTTAFPTTTAASTFYDAYNTNNNQYAKPSAAPKQNVAQTTKFYPNYSNGNTYVPTTYAPVTKKQNGDASSQYYDKSGAKSTQYFEVTKAPKKATQYNNFDNTGKYFESSTTNYDFARSPAGIGFSPSSINLLAETPKTTTPVPRRNGSPTTYNPNSFGASGQRNSQQATTQRPTTYVSGSARPFSTTAKFSDVTTTRPKAAKKNDYDYAYYDNAGALEYDGLDLEHVAGGKESAKIARN